MKLATARKVLATMGIVENQGSLAGAGHLLGLSTSVIENLLETSCSREHRTDFFEATDTASPLRLTNMFVAGESVIVRLRDTSDTLAAPFAGEIVPVAEYTVAVDRGIVQFPAPRSVPVSVTYLSGLSTNAEDAELLDAPVWLQDIAVAVAVYGMNMLQTSVTNRKDRNVAGIATELRNMSSMLLGSRRRPRMTVAFPSASVLHE